MNTFLYARVSTKDQNLGLQIEALTSRYPSGLLREEKASATTMARPVLRLILDMMQSGDKLIVWKLDRLARNMHDLSIIVAELESKGASLEILDQAIDTGTASGKAFLQMLGVFAEFETNLRKERQMAGIAKAKAEGKALGRKKTINSKAVLADIEDKQLTHKLIAAKHNISESAVYKIKRGEM